MEEDFFIILNNNKKTIIAIIVVCLAFGFLSYMDSDYFHFIIEFICIVISFSIYVISLNASEFLRETNFHIFGLSFAFVGAFDFLHAISYMYVPFSYLNNIDLSIKLHIIARLCESICFVLFFSTFDKSNSRKIKSRVLYLVVLCSILCVFAYLGLLPTFYIQNVGVRPIKAFFECINIMVFFLATLLCYKNKDFFDDMILRIVSFSIAVKVISSFFFLLSNGETFIYYFIAHITKFLSFMLLYWAITKKAIRMPHNMLKERAEELSRVNAMLRIEMEERKAAQRELKEQYDFLQKLMDAIPNPIFYKGINGQYRDCNKAFLDVFELKKEEIIGKTVYDIAPFENADMYNAMDILTLENKGKQSYEYKIQTKSDQNRHVIFSKAPLYNKAEELYGITGVITDISDRKNIEEQLAISEKKNRKLVEVLPDALFIHNGGYLLYSNMSGVELLKAKSKEELIGRKILDFVHPDFYDKVRERIELIRGEAEITPFIEEKFIALDGSYIDVEVVTCSFPYQNADDILVVCRDITERKKAEESIRYLREKNESERLKTEFFANISHELRTPINVLLGTLQLTELFYRDISYDSNICRIKNYNVMMKQNCYRLLHLANNLIDMTKIDSGYMDIALQNLDIVSIVEDISMSVAGYIESKNRKLIFDTDIEEKIIACDIQKIERIVLNLLSNAVKFTKNGGSIEVSIRDRFDKIIIAVKDDGIGIPEDKINQIFDRFKQVDNLMTRSNEGSGIGLSIVKSLVEMQNGKVYVNSKFGIGSEFIVELPAITIEQESSIISIDKYLRASNSESVQIEFSDIYA